MSPSMWNRQRALGEGAGDVFGTAGVISQPEAEVHLFADCRKHFTRHDARRVFGCQGFLRKFRPRYQKPLDYTHSV
jgi:hypothetical protein